MVRPKKERGLGDAGAEKGGDGSYLELYFAIKRLIVF